jgi:hypothetical protein
VPCSSAPSINGAALAEVDNRFAGLASGVLNTFRQMGLTIGVVCFLAVAGLAARHIRR